MNRRRSRHITLLLMTASIAMLAAAVFCWGLQYKCSLYPSPHHPSAKIPAAKLLTENERVRDDASSQPRQLTSPAPLLLISSLCFAGYAARVRIRHTRIPLPLRMVFASPQSSSFIHFSLRPPPTPAF